MPPLAGLGWIVSWRRVSRWGRLPKNTGIIPRCFRRVGRCRSTNGSGTSRCSLARSPEDATGWLHRAYALRRINGGGLVQAWEALLPAAKKFPQEPVIAYNLSCYACQMQQLDIARHWLQRAVMAGQKDGIKKMALADEDLQPLWPEIEDF